MVYHGFKQNADSFLIRCAVTGGTVQLLYWPEATQNSAAVGAAGPVTVGPGHQSNTHMSC
jgi:hypothetical protein